MMALPVSDGSAAGANLVAVIAAHDTKRAIYTRARHGGFTETSASGASGGLEIGVDFEVLRSCVLD